jgi:hypothetical protein
MNKGLWGIFKTRRLVKIEINNLSWDQISKLKNNTFTSKDLLKSFPYLRPFKEILLK